MTMGSRTDSSVQTYATLGVGEVSRAFPVAARMMGV